MRHFKPHPSSCRHIRIHGNVGTIRFVTGKSISTNKRSYGNHYIIYV